VGQRKNLVRLPPAIEILRERIAVVARTAFRGQLLQFLHVAASEHDFVGFQSGD